MRIIPAYAGSTLSGRRCRCARWDHPRIRGEHPTPAALGVGAGGSSPHTRGALKWREVVAERCGIIPAYAGSTTSCPLLRSRLPDHPRIRGEHRLFTEYERRGGGSSPHTRGARDRLVDVGFEFGIIPAYAGSTSISVVLSSSPADHPRIRGEHSTSAEALLMKVGSSPHTRGAHLEIPAIPRIAAVIIPVFLYPSPTPQEEADRSMVLLTLS